MRYYAIGLVEFNSIAKGIEAADAMLKAAQVEILFSRPICPGKYVVLITGDVAAVENSVKKGAELGEGTVVDDFVLPNVHPNVLPAITSTSILGDIHSLGVIETFSIAAAIVAADTAVKAGDVDLIEIRLGLGIGGKSFITLTGEVSAVKAAVEAGSLSAAAKGLLVNKAIIPSPHLDLIPAVM